MTTGEATRPGESGGRETPDGPRVKPSRRSLGRAAERALDRAAWWLLPSACLGCSTPLPARRSPLNLCVSCRRRLARSPASACSGCGRPLPAPRRDGAPLESPAESEPGPSPRNGARGDDCLADDLSDDPRCGACRADPPPFARLVTGWLYQPPLDAVVRGLKFHRLDYLAEHLASELDRGLAERLRADPRLAAELAAVDAVVPVPLHRWRRWERGYDQADLIARALAPRLGRPVMRALVRRRSTPAQSGLDAAERRRNVAGAFRLRRRGLLGSAPPNRLAGRSVILLDDVVTTGATLRSAARALVQAGAGRVIALAVARTP